MKKKLLSLLLAGSLVASMAAVATASVSATVLEDGSYVPGDNVEATHRYYFAMPDEWYSENATSAGVYWWSGTDPCKPIDGSVESSVGWPGYKAQKSDEHTNLYYIDCPTDVPLIIWNNYLDGGLDETAPVYTEAKQTINVPTEFYSYWDFNDIYNEEWFLEMEDAYINNKAALGDYAGNFYYDDVYDSGFSFNFDNMVFVVDLSKTDVTIDGKMTYVGEWYFYFGNGDYGTYPTKEASEAAGTLKNIADAPATNDQATDDQTDDNNNNNNNNDNNNGNKPNQPSTDPTSSVGDGSTSDTTTTPGNGKVQTGQTSYAIVLLVVLAAVSGVVVFTRKKLN